MVIGICHRSWEVPVAQRVRARRLTDEEGRQLQQIVRRSKHGSTRVRRALIVMASASGTTVPAIARLVAADEDTVRQVIHRFNEVGLACLDPRWAGGRPRRISPDDEAFIVQAARTRPEKLGRPFTHWSVRKLAAYLPDNPARVVEVRRERLRQLLRHQDHDQVLVVHRDTSVVQCPRASHPQDETTVSLRPRSARAAPSRAGKGDRELHGDQGRPHYRA